VPVRLAPTVPDVPLPASVPVRTALTALVSPLITLSTSVSLVNTLPLPFDPSVPLAIPPASTAVAVSSTPTGASLAPVTVMTSAAVSVRPAASVTV